MEKSFFVDNFGCAKNQVDAEEIATRLLHSGWACSPDLASAALVIVNTCGYIESAKKESLDAVMGLRAAYPGKRILLAGCLAQRYAAELGSDLPEVDGIVGNGDLSVVPEAARHALEGDRIIMVPERSSREPPTRETIFGFPRLAYVKIAEGCSNHCAYCAIPLIRGETASRSVDSVEREVRDLVARGYFELCLIGQDLGAYGTDSGSRQLLPELLSRISGIEGDFRIRMLYIHPDHFPLGILDSCGRDPRILPYFDMPFQHASAKVLAAMNRKGDSGTYLELISRIRRTLPDAVLRSTFLTGFPGEGAAEFEELRRFQDAARLDWLGAFAYSREEGTRAYGMKDRPARRLAEARKRAIQEAQAPITEEALARFVGTHQDVLVEELVEGEELGIGRAWLQAPDVDGSTVLSGTGFSPGDVVKARVIAVHGVDLEAVPHAP